MFASSNVAVLVAAGEVHDHVAVRGRGGIDLREAAAAGAAALARSLP